MTDIQVIESVLKRAATRRRWQRAWRAFWLGLLIGGLLWLAALATYKLFPAPPTLLPLAGLLAGASLLAGFVAGWWRKASLPETARWLDDREQLQERLSTALELEASGRSSEWRRLVMADAARHAGQVDARRLLPYGLPKASRWTLLVLALSAGLGFVPEYRSKAYLQKQREAEVIRDTGRALAGLTRRSLERRPPVLEPARRTLEAVAELGDKLGKVQLTRNEALRDLASATERLKEQVKDLAQNPSFKSLERAARKSGTSGATGSGELQKQIEALQKSLANQPSDTGALDQFKKDLQKVKEAAAGLPNESSAGSEAARNQLSQALADLARRAQELGLTLPSLEEAIAALSASRIDQLLRDLDVAAVDLEKIKALAEALEKLQLQWEKIGKDLAEQLEKGQAEFAASRLYKMAEQLRSENLTQEQAQKLLDEVSHAIDPAGKYGLVGNYLKQGVKQMQQGQRTAAAQSLTEAAKELERLLQELGDCQALLASLGALQRAQMCIGNCQGWGQCQGPPKVGKGGRPGKGVGTWADEGDGMIPEIMERWDNTGLERPDMAPRGWTDRGPGQLADNLAPTKLKGQMNPGGPMPSITLKGVSIKGLSKVEFKEMATAAQSEAQSAISQEQVPRAYQGAVRDYFDDLKE